MTAEPAAGARGCVACGLHAICRSTHMHSTGGHARTHMQHFMQNTHTHLGSSGFCGAHTLTNRSVSSPPSTYATTRDPCSTAATPPAADMLPRYRRATDGCDVDQKAAALLFRKNYSHKVDKKCFSPISEVIFCRATMAIALLSLALTSLGSSPDACWRILDGTNSPCRNATSCAGWELRGCVLHPPFASPLSWMCAHILHEFV